MERAYNAVWLDVGTELSEDLRTSLIVDPPNGRLPALTEAAVARTKEQNDLGTPPARDLFSSAKVLASPETFRPPDPESLGAFRTLSGRIQRRPAPESERLQQHSANRADSGPRGAGDGDDPRRAYRTHRWGRHTCRPTSGVGPATPAATGKAIRWSLIRPISRTRPPPFNFPTTRRTTLWRAPWGSGLHLHLTERFTRTGEDRLRYEYTIDDPTTFVRPFTVAITLRATDDRMYEFACHEGNYSAPAILRGARLLEREESGS